MKFSFKTLLHKVGLLITIAVIAFTLFVIGRTCLTIIRTYAAIHRLEAERDGYLQSIAEDSTLIKHLQYDEYLEQYAREHYHMQRRNDHVYIIEDD